MAEEFRGTGARGLPAGARYRHKASGEVWRVLHQPATPGGVGKVTIVQGSV